MSKAFTAFFIGTVFLLTALTPSRAQTNAPDDAAKQAHIQQWRTAISEIFDERTKARQRWEPKKGSRSNKRYAQKIAAFDTTHCPKSFRIAWINYVTAWQKLAAAPSGIIPFVEVVAGATHGNVALIARGSDGLVKDAEIKKQDAYGTFAAMAECQKIAIHYGADFPAD
jgi:hypothetical protein